MNLHYFDRYRKNFRNTGSVISLIHIGLSMQNRINFGYLCL